MSGQTKLRAWIARKAPGEEFTTADVRAFLKVEGFDESQSGNLMTHMLNWWKLVRRIKHGHYKRL